MIKKALTILAIVLMAMPMTIKADTYPTDKTSWEVVFDGKKLSANFTSREVADALEGMQPGDSADLEITVSNSHTSSATWWLENEVLKSFEDSSKASDGAYRYSLTYTDPSDATTILYSSEKVGGTGSSEGLREATDALDDMFVLGDIGAGKSGVVRLHIELDGETQNNSYQDTLARLQLNFAVELPDEAKVFRIPKTGTLGGLLEDSSTLYYIGFGVSFVVLLALTIYEYNDYRKARAR